MPKGPTVYDVAQRAGVSIATVSFAFRQPHRVRETTRKAVLDAADALGYLPSGSARGLARGKTGVLGIYSFDFYNSVQADGADVAGGFANDDKDRPASASAGMGYENRNADFRFFPLYVDEVQRGLELECWVNGYTLMVSSGNALTGLNAADIAGRVDGLAIFSKSVPADVLKLIARRIPVVEIAEPPHSDALSHITVDNAGGMRELTQHLLHDHKLTRLQFAGPGDFSVSSDFRARFQGFQETLRDAGLSVPQEPLYFGTGSELTAGDLVARLLKTGEMPQAFVCALDEYALQLMDALSEVGIEVPDKVAVTGFDGIVAGRVIRPSLTTVSQPMEQIGRLAARILIDKSTNPEKPPEDRQLPVQLAVRESCGCSSA